MKKALIVDDDRSILTTLEIHLQGLGYETLTAANGRTGLMLFEQARPEVVLLDLRLPDMDGLEVLRAMNRTGHRAFVVVITAHAAIDTAVQAIRDGAFDYVPKPFGPDQITHVLRMIEKVTALEAEVDSLRGIVREGELITRSRKLRAVLATARQVADTDAGVLLLGESGTGKGVIARLIHQWSPRQEGPFVTVDCAGLQESLLESDLFGHVRGAFTGALRDKPGKLEVADGGTVFMDEVAEMPPQVQARLLRFLQHREFERVGEVHPRRVDVRVIAATNRDLDELIAEGLFRRDLYFRLNVVELVVPPLRERPEDIELIATNHLARLCAIYGKPARSFSTEVLQLLSGYSWPGNVRELVNLVERCAILSSHEQIAAGDLPDHLRHPDRQTQGENSLPSLAELERDHIRRVLARTSSLEEAARILGIDPATLWRKRKRYGLS